MSGAIRVATMGVVALLALAACTSTEPSGKSRPNAESLQQEILSLHGRASSSGLDFQADLLADGVIDYQEYEKAVLATISCLRDQGFDVIGPVPASGGELDYSYGGASTLEESERQGAVGVDCEETYLNYVAAAYASVIAPSAEERQERLVSYAQCLRDAGVDLPDIVTEAEFDMDMLAIEHSAVSCMKQFSDTASVSEVGD